MIASTSGRLHGEFVRFMYFLAHKRAMDFFAAIGQAKRHSREREREREREGGREERERESCTVRLREMKTG